MLRTVATSQQAENILIAGEREEEAGRSRLLGLANLTGAFDTKLTFYKLVSQVKATPAAAAAA